MHNPGGTNFTCFILYCVVCSHCFACPYRVIPAGRHISTTWVWVLLIIYSAKTMPMQWHQQFYSDQHAVGRRQTLTIGVISLFLSLSLSLYMCIYTSVNPRTSIFVSDDTEPRQSEVSGAESSLEPFHQMASWISSSNGTMPQRAWAQKASWENSVSISKFPRARVPSTPKRHWGLESSCLESLDSGVTSSWVFLSFLDLAVTSSQVVSSCLDLEMSSSRVFSVFSTSMSLRAKVSGVLSTSVWLRADFPEVPWTSKWLQAEFFRTKWPRSALESRFLEQSCLEVELCRGMHVCAVISRSEQAQTPWESPKPAENRTTTFVWTFVSSTQ
jgi:hypothetical protein